MIGLPPCAGCPVMVARGMEVWSERAACQFSRRIFAAVAPARSGTAPAPADGGGVAHAGRGRVGGGGSSRGTPDVDELVGECQQHRGNTVQARSGTSSEDGGVAYLRRRIREPVAIRGAAAAVAPHE